MEPTLKLYLLCGTESGYDTYSEIIVAADSEKQASLISPRGEIHPWPQRICATWCVSNDPSKIEVKYLGEASPIFKPNEVILTSFNAG